MTLYKIRNLGLALFGASFFLLISCGNKREASIELSDDLSAISVINTPDIIAGQKVNDYFKLFILDNEGEIREGQVPVTGTYKRINNDLIFTPQYSLTKGASYLATFDYDALNLEERFTIPLPEHNSKTTVHQIYPSADQLPRNLLKFYIQFTDSMASGFAYENISLTDQNGNEIKDAFLELGEELWSPDMKRFTLLFDPGRIKTGLRSQEDLGYTFEVNHNYSLTINKEWPDAWGNPIEESFQKEFRIVSDDRFKPEPSQWELQAPDRNVDPLTIDFHEHLDYALLTRIITVWQGDNQIDGTIELEDAERYWTFRPNQNWIKGDYEIRVEYILEDLAGNNLKNTFDVDNTSEVTNLTPDKFISLKFSVD